MREYYTDTLYSVPIELNDICTYMSYKGYEYASFINRNFTPILREGGIFSQDITQDLKPLGLYFSKLEHYVFDETDNQGNIIEDRLCVPGWYMFSNIQDERNMEDIKDRDIVFAKFDNTKMFDFDNEYLDFWKTEAQRLSSKHNIPMIDFRYDINVHSFLMSDIMKKYQGLFASNLILPIGSWDVQTACVWNTACIKEYHFFLPLITFFITF